MRQRVISTLFAGDSTSSPGRRGSRSSGTSPDIRRGCRRRRSWTTSTRAGVERRSASTGTSRRGRSGIVENVELPENRRQNGLPYTFYGISEEGSRFLEEHKLLGAEAALREVYDRVEKPAEIERYESAPRPDR
jgi:hypothetical protein